MKKVLVILLFLIVLGAGGFGTFHFYRQNSNQLTLNATLTQKNAQVQSQLDAIGAMTVCYQVPYKVYSGKPIDVNTLKQVSVPVSTLGEASITDIADLQGMAYRVDVQPGTILSKDMLMEQDSEIMKFPREVDFMSVPVTLKVGDYIDIRILLPNAEEYVVFNRKRVERLFNTTVTIFVTEEENVILNAAIADYAQYNQYTLLYMMKYLEPGNANSAAFFPVQHDVENFVRFNKNITDPTRCINETLRDHIDEVLLLYSSSQNSQMASAFINGMRTQLTSQLSMQADWVVKMTDDNGNFNPTNSVSQDGLPIGNSGGSSSTPTDDGTSQNFDQAVGEAVDSLDQSLDGLLEETDELR